MNSFDKVGVLVMWNWFRRPHRREREFFDLVIPIQDGFVHITLPRDLAVSEADQICAVFRAMAEVTDRTPKSPMISLP